MMQLRKELRVNFVSKYYLLTSTINLYFYSLVFAIPVFVGLGFTLNIALFSNASDESLQWHVLNPRTTCGLYYKRQYRCKLRL